MLPSLPVHQTSSKDVCKKVDRGNKGNCEASIVATFANNSDKLLHPLTPKPITIVCMPDIPNLSDKEMEIPVKHEGTFKNTEENNEKVTSVKSEKDCEEEICIPKRIPTGRSPPKVTKKKPKQIRDLEKTLNCLLADNEQVKDEKAFAFAQSYFLKVTETLHGKDDATYFDFMKTMNDFGHTIFDATDLYKKVTKIFEKYPSLADEFLAFLLPEQAMQCGKFMEYIMITKMTSFCRKLELYYSKQPSQLHKIYSSLSTLASNNKATLEDLKSTVLPLLKNNSLLVNMFLELIPTEAPHASSLTDYESMDFSNVDIQNQKTEDWFETVEVPPPADDDGFGGDHCVCTCHTSGEGNSRRRYVHCMSCGTKFKQGRVYIHSGHMLRPARVCFKEMRTKAIERLSVKNIKNQRKIDRSRGTPSNSKRSSTIKSETSANVSVTSNKLSPPKAKKTPKGKPLNEIQKKPNKTTSPKSSQNKKNTNDNKISKPSRKRLKMLTISSESQLGCASPPKPQLTPPKKGTSQTAKADVKATTKNKRQLLSEQSDKDYRGTRLAARNIQITAENNSCRKPNRRQTGNFMKKESLKEVPLLNKTEECALKRHSVSFLENQISNESLSKSSTDSEAIENATFPIIENQSGEDIENKHMKKCQVNVKLSRNSTVFSSSGTLSERLIHETSKEMDEDEMISDSLSFPSEIQNLTEKEHESEAMDQTLREVSSEDDTTHFSMNSNSKLSSDGHLSDPSSQLKIIKDYSQCVKDLTRCKEDNTRIELLDIKEHTENDHIQQVGDKLFNSEDFHESSSDSEIEENIEMDVDESFKVTKEENSLSKQDNTMHASKEGNISSVALKKVVNEKLSTSPWTRDEDKIILRTFQSLNNSDKVFQTISGELPSRTAEEVRSRFQTLMSFLQKMAGDQK